MTDQLVVGRAQPLTASEAVRRTALRVLGDRLDILQARGRRARLTPLERRELNEVESAIQLIRNMDPAGGSSPARLGALD